MRHRSIGRKFNRTSSHRIAMFRNMAISLFKYELIKTTVYKAKDLRRIIEPLITLSKKDTISNRRLVFSRLGNKEVIKHLFEDFGPRYKTRLGGYTRILKCGFRKSDSVSMAYIELVDRVNIKDNKINALEKIKTIDHQSK